MAYPSRLAVICLVWSTSGRYLRPPRCPPLLFPRPLTRLEPRASSLHTLATSATVSTLPTQNNRMILPSILTALLVPFALAAPVKNVSRASGRSSSSSHDLQANAPRRLTSLPPGYVWKPQHWPPTAIHPKLNGTKHASKRDCSTGSWSCSGNVLQGQCPLLPNLLTTQSASTALGSTWLPAPAVSSARESFGS